MMAAGDSLEGAARRRSELEEALQQVERAVAAPAATVTWADEVTHRMRRLEIALNHHIVEVESPSGLLDQIVERAPRLQRQVEGVRHHHFVLARSITEILHKLRTARTVGTAPTDEIRKATIDLLAEMTRHRLEGADLVYDAYDIDIGGY
ncbi:MAG: hypothetical protein U9N84_04065 [Actinomycetota bacterium]|nr:hypothetical protein [Actinomycetota bacterium]